MSKHVTEGPSPRPEIRSVIRGNSECEISSVIQPFNFEGNESESIWKNGVEEYQCFNTESRSTSSSIAARSADVRSGCAAHPLLVSTSLFCFEKLKSEERSINSEMALAVASSKESASPQTRMAFPDRVASIFIMKGER